MSLLWGIASFVQSVGHLFVNLVSNLVLMT
jgi:hypothetical protein